MDDLVDRFSEIRQALSGLDQDGVVSDLDVPPRRLFGFFCFAKELSQLSNLVLDEQDVRLQQPHNAR